MTAETDIAAIDDGGANTAAEVRTALTSVLGRADALIEETALAASATSITFSSIPNTYRTLRLVGMARTDRASQPSDQVAIQVGNGTVDTGNNYTYMRIVTGDGAGTSHAAATGSWANAAFATAATADAGFFVPFEVLILNYADTSQFRHASGSSRQYATTVNRSVMQFSGVWSNAADAIDIMTLTPNFGTNFVAGTQVSLYGLK